MPASCETCEKTESDSVKLQKCPCLSLWYCGKACQRANWPQHRAQCLLVRARLNRAEETSLAAPLGDAFIFSSITRWRDEIWIPYGREFLQYIHIPDYGSDTPIITIELQHQPNATELHSQWRPTSFTINPFEAIEIGSPGLPHDFVSKLREIQARPIREQPNGRPFGPAQIIQFDSTFKNSAGSTSRTMSYVFNHPVCLTPCSLDPANATLDWTGAWFSFMQTAPKENWGRGEDIEDHAAVYFFSHAGDEWRMLARRHWANLNRAEERYLRRKFESLDLGYHELTAQAYVLKYHYGEMEGGWIPLEDRETYASLDAVE
ncbi:hypothetical protein RQP46_002423 [Phenoliferia psychrophenolica]